MLATSGGPRCCGRCGLVALPGQASCLRCRIPLEAVAAASPEEVAPPRAPAWRKQLDRWWLVRRASRWLFRPPLTQHHASLWILLLVTPVPGLPLAWEPQRWLVPVTAGLWLGLLGAALISYGTPWYFWLLVGALMAHTSGALHALRFHLAEVGFATRMLAALTLSFAVQFGMYTPAARLLETQWPLVTLRVPQPASVRTGDVVSFRRDVAPRETLPALGELVFVRFDLVGESLLVDRVIGLPGDVVALDGNGRVLRNGTPLDAYNVPLGQIPRERPRTLRVPPGAFCLIPTTALTRAGWNSTDAVFTRMCMRKPADIEGRPLSILYPLHRRGPIPAYPVAAEGGS